MSQKNAPVALAYGAAKGGKIAGKVGLVVARRVPLWAWPVGLIGAYFGVKYLWGKAEEGIKKAPLRVLKHASAVAAATVAAAERFMMLTITSMTNVARHLALSIKSILDMEDGIDIDGANEQFFNTLNVNQVNKTFNLLVGRAQTQGYITAYDWKSLVTFMKHEADFATIGKSYYNVAPGSFAKITSLYAMAKDGQTPVVAPYDLAIGEIAMKARTNKSITQRQYEDLASAISKGSNKQSMATSKNVGLILITQAGLDLAKELNAAIEVGDITVE